jgi:hypothetical protein
VISTGGFPGFPEPGDDSDGSRAIENQKKQIGRQDENMVGTGAKRVQLNFGGWRRAHLRHDPRRAPRRDPQKGLHAKVEGNDRGAKGRRKVDV